MAGASRQQLELERKERERWLERCPTVEARAKPTTMVAWSALYPFSGMSTFVREGCKKRSLLVGLAY